MITPFPYCLNTSYPHACKPLFANNNQLTPDPITVNLRWELMRICIKRFPPAKSGAGSPFWTNLSSHLFPLVHGIGLYQRQEWIKKVFVIMIGRSLIPTNLRKLRVVGMRDDKFFECMREGRSGDSKQKFQHFWEISLESPLLPSHCSPFNDCHPERIHPSHLQIFEGTRWMSRGISKVYLNFWK